MNERLPKRVQAFTQLFVGALNKHLPENIMEGVYIYGSIALGAFNEQKSDIDFIVLLKRELSDQEVGAIKAIHSQMNNYEFGKRMDGVYVQASLVGKTNEEQPMYPYCSDGKVSLGHWDVNHITWWVLKRHGIALQGTPIAELNLPTEWDDILKTLEYNVNKYWFTKTKKRYLFLFDSMIEFTTCTISRIICSLEQQAIFSKDEAVKLCLATLPEKWHLLLNEGARIRSNANKKSLYKNKIKRAKDCRDFILYTHQLYKEDFLKRGNYGNKTINSR
ncbi:nucleotidyltransferase domain-containing protein [Psychrobacillus glaciei]|nr:nucleotidyltransferase domain-containing protein [Psychrobacillus glaciei]